MSVLVLLRLTHPFGNKTINNTSDSTLVGLVQQGGHRRTAPFDNGPIIRPVRHAPPEELPRTGREKGVDDLTVEAVDRAQVPVYAHV